MLEIGRLSWIRSLATLVPRCEWATRMRMMIRETQGMELVRTQTSAFAACDEPGIAAQLDREDGTIEGTERIIAEIGAGMNRRFKLRLVVNYKFSGWRWMIIPNLSKPMNTRLYCTSNHILSWTSLNILSLYLTFFLYIFLCL